MAKNKAETPAEASTRGEEFATLLFRQKHQELFPVVVQKYKDEYSKLVTEDKMETPRCHFLTGLIEKLGKLETENKPEPANVG